MDGIGSNQRRVLVLCFDGTGNQFTGTAADSNVVKIFRMVDGENPNVFRYYQPGIGTYIEDSALSKTSRLAKVSSSYKKIKDQMYGTSFDQHVKGGYQFLMRYYEPDSDIYLFGFSRGAYTARFLAQMLDCIGLLSRGNEEMFRFAWKAFAQWQARLEATEEQRAKKKEMFEFMKGFRETFGRPVRRIRFLGLFDTVNSVPRFESKWMARTKYPYVAKSSAKIVRHAVAIDERRAKFRQNLISQQRPHQYAHDGTHHLQSAMHMFEHHGQKNQQEEAEENDLKEKPPLLKRATFGGRFKPRHSKKAAHNDLQLPVSSAASITSATNAEAIGKDGDSEAESDDENQPQDIHEVWFPGQHGDVGGGWPLEAEEEYPLSYAPLVWMLREARKAGLPFDEDDLREQGYVLDDPSTQGPILEVEGQPIEQTGTTDRTEFLRRLQVSTHKGKIHDSLRFGQGLGGVAVGFWNFMEYLPFRRMDLRPDGTWAPIRWPLPCGETRDIPHDAVISHTAIKKMQVDPSYRPGNLIIGGGGRGIRIAPAEKGTGRWKILRESGDPIGEVYVKDLEEVNGNAQS